MWVITVFEQKDVRTFEYTDKREATKAFREYNKNAICLIFNELDVEAIFSTPVMR